MTDEISAGSRSAAARTMILPLALAQFIASYAATNMNVAISSIAKDLGTTVSGVQTAITLFTLTMASLMIPGSKLTDIWGRKRCFVIGLTVYGAGALLAVFSFGIWSLIIGYSLLEGVGSALMIPPIYILVTVAFPDITSPARPPLSATMADHRWLRYHHGWHSPAAGSGQAAFERPQLDTGTSADRHRDRDHADLVRQRRSVRLPRR